MNRVTIKELSHDKGYTLVMAFQLLYVHIPSVIGDKGHKAHYDGQKKGYEDVDNRECIFLNHLHQLKISERSDDS